MTTTRKQAAAVLQAMLAELQQTSTAADQRIRTAVLVAARALQRDRDPLRALEATYRRTGH